ncbi:MAG TPA: glycosyl hydrolase [Phycisphaerae bacterium]|nr:glycosyl hydrolase [Phycisphaerae bacterium]
MKSIRPLLLALPALVLLPSPARTATLDDNFLNPPDSAKPRTWWHWVSGNVSAEGITADLEAMKHIGLAGAQNFTVDQSAVHGPIKFMSPEWRNLVHHALSEAHRLNLQISMEGCDGWSESGGPWITPAQSMQKIVWTERTIPGNQAIPLNLPQPETIRDFYRDIALFAFPASPHEPPAPTAITASADHFDASKISDADPATSTSLPALTQPQTRWIQLAFNPPATCSSLLFFSSGGNGRQPFELDSSNDGTTFTKITSIKRNRLNTFPTTTASFFRLLIPPYEKASPEISIAELHLAGNRINNLTGQSGIEVDRHANDFPNSSSPAEDSINPTTIITLTGKSSWDAPPGDWTIVRLGHTSTGVTTHPSTAAGLECDKLSRDAVTAQFNGMFGPVIADSPSLIGNTLTDILLDSWEAGCENWTPLMPDDFKSRRGYDLAPYLPAFTGRIVGSADQTQRFFWDFRRTLADLVADNHYGTWHDLAHQHGMFLTSEATGIGLPTVADQLQCKGRCDIPMGEFWVSRTFDNNIDDPHETASAAHIYGQNIAATESFTSSAHSASWKNDPQSLKALGDFEFCQGVNRFIFHRYAHQPWLDRKPGMSMGPWGINFERTNTWWNQGAAWISYITRSQYLLQQGRYAADLCYFYGEGAPATLSHKDLTPAPPTGYSYDVCNAEVLLHHASVDHGDLVLDSGMRYRLLVLPPTDRITLPLLQKIASLVNAGATIYGPRPQKSPSLANYPQDDAAIQSLAQKLWADCDGKTITEHPCGQGKIVDGEDLQKALATPPDFQSTPTTPNLLFIHRTDPAANTDIYFLSNQQDTDFTAQCTFRIPNKSPELFHPDSATIESPALYQSDQNRTTLPIHFDPFGSVFVIFRHPADAAPLASIEHDGKTLFTPNTTQDADAPTISDNKISLLARQPGAYTLTTRTGQTHSLTAPALPAPLTLPGPWQLTFPPNLGAPPSATFDKLISFTDSSDPGIKYFSGTATYSFDFTLPADFLQPNRRAFLDLGSVKNLAEISLNNLHFPTLWKAPFRLDITPALRPGTNHLEIKITNLWPNRLIGDQRLPEDKRITWTSVDLFKPDSPLLPSGLLGPVTIIPAEILTLPQPAK